MKKIVLFWIGLLVCLTSCVTGSSVVSNFAELEKYQYASLTNVMNYGSSAKLMYLEVKVYDALVGTKLKIIGDRQIDELSASQKEQLLLVRFSVNQDYDEAVISVNFVDYATGTPIASCRGSFGFGVNEDDDVQGALDGVIEQMELLFKKE